MEKYPELDPHNEPHRSHAVDDYDESTLHEGYVYYADGRPVVSTDYLKNFIENEKRKREIKKQAIEIFTSVSNYPEKTKEDAEDFFDNHFGLKIIDSGSMMVYNGVSNLTNSDVSSVLVLSAHTIDQFAGMFWANLRTFNEDDLNLVREAAIESLAISYSAKAFYENLIGGLELGELVYKRRISAIKRLINSSIGSSEITYIDSPDETNEIFAGIAYRTMISKLKKAGFYDDPGMNRIESRNDFMCFMCLTAVRATNDDLFVGIASSKNKETSDEYIRAVVNHKFPRLAR